MKNETIGRQMSLDVIVLDEHQVIFTSAPHHGTELCSLLHLARFCAHLSGMPYEWFRVTLRLLQWVCKYSAWLWFSCALLFALNQPCKRHHVRTYLQRIEVSQCMHYQATLSPLSFVQLKTLYASDFRISALLQRFEPSPEKMLSFHIG